jgi:NAD dependent epimerase/dehydratase
MSLRGKQVLVTGAGGFIGSHIVERLVADGARVRAFVHYNALGTRGWLDASAAAADVKVVAGDIQDAESIAHACEGVEVAFHLASLIGIPYSYAAPASYVATNIGGTLNLLQAARRTGMRVVHTSTSEVYGTARSVPITEDHPLQAQSPYAASKVGADKLVESYHLSFGVQTVTVRPFNTFGPRQSTRAIVPTIIAQCLAGGPLRLGRITPTRDLNYIEDTVDGFVRAGSAPDAIGATINLGTGRETSIYELAHLVAGIVGVDTRIEEEERRLRPATSEVERLVADASRAKALLDWEPRIPLEDGIARTVEWMRSNPSSLPVHAYGV